MRFVKNKWVSVHIVLQMIFVASTYTRESAYTSTTEQISTQPPLDLRQSPPASNSSFQANRTETKSVHQLATTVSSEEQEETPSQQSKIPIHHSNLPQIHAHKHDPSQTETFLGQVTLNSPAELPPEFNFQRPSQFAPKLLRPAEDVRIKTATPTPTTTTTQNLILTPLYRNFKPTKYAIVPRDKTFDLEPLLEEPMNKKEYYKHNKQDVQVINSAVTESTLDGISSTDITDDLGSTNASTAAYAEMESSERETNPEKEDVTDEAPITSIGSDGGVSGDFDEVVTEMMTSGTTGDDNRSSDIDVTLSTATTWTTIKLPTKARNSTIRMAVTAPKGDKNANKSQNRTLSYSRINAAAERDKIFRFTTGDHHSILYKPYSIRKFNLTKTVNIPQKSNSFSTQATSSVAFPKSTEKNVFPERKWTTSSTSEASQKQWRNTTKVIENSPKNNTKTALSPVKRTYWTASTTLPSTNATYTTSTLPSTNPTYTSQKASSNIDTSRKLVPTDEEVFDRNRPLALVKSWSTRSNRKIETVSPATHRNFETNFPVSSKPKHTSFNVCSGDCDLAGIIRLTGGVVWAPELSDRTSEAWKVLAKEVRSQLERIYNKSNFLKKWYKSIRIDGFSEGSVLVDYIVEFKNTGRPINTFEIRRIFHESLDEAAPSSARDNSERIRKNLGNFTLDPIYTDFIVMPRVPSTIEYAEANLLPQWAIAVIVVGLASLLFVVIFGVTILTNRKKTSRKKAALPFAEDIFSEFHKKHILGIENFGAENLYGVE